MRTKKKYRLGVIGFGRMGKAIACGAIEKNYLERYDICVYDPDVNRQQEAVTERFQVYGSVAEAAKDSHILLMACPRSVLPEILPELKQTDIPCILSIIKGITSSYFREYLPDVPVIRALINTPLKIKEGSTAMSMSEGVRADEYDFCYTLFKLIGKVCTVPEEKLDMVQAMHAETPAYICCFADALLSGAEDMGLDSDSARELLVQSLIGTARLLQKYPTASLSEVIDLLCDNDPPSKAALLDLMNQKMDEIIHNTAVNTLELIHKEEL